MKRSFKLLAVFALPVMFITLYSCGGGNEQPANEEGGNMETVEVTDTEHAYLCPMNCENSASMEAGNCPVCGMELKPNPNYEGSADAEAERTDVSDEGAEMEEGAEEGAEMDGEMHDHDGDDHEGHSHS
jgi:hypothetical protein